MEKESISQKMTFKEVVVILIIAVALCFIFHHFKNKSIEERQSKELEKTHLSLVHVKPPVSL